MKWIPVTERLPDHENDVWASDGKEYQRLSCGNNGIWFAKVNYPTPLPIVGKVVKWCEIDDGRYHIRMK